MPFKCCVPSCSGNYGYGGAPKVAVFGFPKDEKLKSKWLHAIPRAAFTPSHSSKVCELHFDKEDVIREVTKCKKSSKKYARTLKRPCLKVGAIPHIFPNGPKYLSKPCSSVPESREDKITDIKHEHLARTLKESEAEFLAHQESDSFQNFKNLLENEAEFLAHQESDYFQNFEKLLDILVSFEKKNWCKINDASKVTFLKLENNPGPTTSYAVIINSNLRMETYLHGHEISIRFNDIKTPCNINTLKIIENCLNSIDSIETEKNTEDDFQQIINYLTDILDSLHCGDPEKRNVLNFFSEQLKLQIAQKARYRYSTGTKILSSILYTISPHAYKYLRHYSSLVLPHPSSIQTLCNKFLTDPTDADEERKFFLVYARNIFKSLEDHERNVILLIDEIHIQPYLDIKGGNIAGTSSNNSSLPTFAYTFTISSITSKLKEVVHIFPSSTLNSEILFECIRTMILKLEEIGYKIICVICDNNALSGKAMNNFSPKKEQSIVYPHPCDNMRPLFFLFDSVHILKYIKNDWLSSKNNKILTFPDFETSDKKIANFNSLVSLHQLEHDKLLKFGYSSSLKALFSTKFEPQNVSLALKIFNPFVRETLLKFGTNIENSTETADFINVVLTWWKIVNVKTPLHYKGQRLLDNFEEPITAESSNDPKLLFLHKMVNWLDNWKSGDFSNKLTSQTHTAFLHTIYGMIEIIQYCFHELKLNYVLLGKFQTDPLEPSIKQV